MLLALAGFDPQPTIRWAVACNRGYYQHHCHQPKDHGDGSSNCPGDECVNDPGSSGSPDHTVRFSHIVFHREPPFFLETGKRGMGEEGFQHFLLLSSSPPLLFQCLFFHFLRFPHSITHFVERLCDRFQVRRCVLKTHCQGVGWYVGLHL